MKSSGVAVAALAALFAFANIPGALSRDENFVYGYECGKSGLCSKVELSANSTTNATSLSECRLFCGEDLATLWPKPTGAVKVSPGVRRIDSSSIEFRLPGSASHSLWKATQHRWLDLLKAKIPKGVESSGDRLTIIVTTTQGGWPKLTLDTDESYTLTVNSSTIGHVTANINATNFFGARHGLETLAQLIVYDDIHYEAIIAGNVTINDAPVYKWRGLLLDTARNFFSVKSIKRTLDAMAMVKLNTFHWHITDSHSFPFEVLKQPELSRLGAYTPKKVYTHEDVASIVEYGLVRGIRVMPEFDEPAHVGEGWQHKNMTACFNAQPWVDYCVEAPCGQLDPTVDALYPVLEDIYSEMFELFDPDVFHMGGDEVSVSCWNSSERIRNWMKLQGWGLEEADFMRLWGHFQTEALKRVDRVANGSHTPITLWTSRLTEEPYIDQYLDKNRYIIQIWTTGDDPKVQEILKRGFKIIVSNYDALYFDCGGAGWVDGGNNWCSPYIGWQKVYDNNLTHIAGNYSDSVLGAEAAIWSEQIDETTLDSRFWPRASAAAERLWSNPKTTWQYAEARMLMHRDWLVENGIGAEALQPEWCVQNENECPLHPLKY